MKASTAKPPPKRRRFPHNLPCKMTHKNLKKIILKPVYYSLITRFDRKRLPERAKTTPTQPTSKNIETSTNFIEFENVVAKTTLLL
jgi:hypothetical protein